METYTDYSVSKDNDINIETSDPETFQTFLSWSIFNNFKSTPTTSPASVTCFRLGFWSGVLEIRLIDSPEDDEVVSKVLKYVYLFTRILL